MKFEDLKFDFDDIKLAPKTNTDIDSRGQINYYHHDKLPIIAAPMDSVVDLSNWSDFYYNNIPICYPRTINPEDFSYVHDKRMAFRSFGLQEIELIIHRGLTISTDYVLIDIANGHMKRLYDTAIRFKKRFPEKLLMVGNVGNPETYKWYAESGAVDFIRVGIGNGNGCLTTKQTAIGYPMGSLINECYDIKKQLIQEYTHKYFHSEDKEILNEKINSLPKIVADGGMKDYSDIIKALALGADYVMIGSIFNKALESSGQNYLHKWKINRKLAKFLYHKGFAITKQFYGMSTKIAQKKMGRSNLKTSEGVVRYRKVEYTLNGWVDNFRSYLASAMSYSGAKTLEDFIGKTEIIFITRNAFNRFNK